MKKGRKIGKISGKLEGHPFAGKTIYMAPQDEIDKYDERLQEMLLDCFGVDGALLTDLSSLSDFTSPWDDADDFAAGMEKLRLNYDAQAQATDCLVDIAKRIWG